MCLTCICCCSTNCCVIFTSILTAIEAVLFASLNLCLMLIYQCQIQPPGKNNLVVGSEFIEQCWSWFFYDEHNCEQKHGESYEPPPWIVDTPEYFANSSVVMDVTPYVNFCYQIIYFVLHSIWFFTSIILLLGNIKKNWLYFLPWLILAILITFMDTLIGAFYIALMDDTHPGWTDGQAIFSMQFLYFRTFSLYLYNILAIFSISCTCLSLYRKRNKIEKVVKKLNKKQNDEFAKKTVVTTVLEDSGESMPSISSSISFYDPVPMQVQAEMHNIEEYQPFADEELPPNIDYPFESQRVRNTTVQRYRPFSYINPSYRPTDPHDLEGMKSHTMGITMDSFPPVGRIPRACLKK